MPRSCGTAGKGHAHRATPDALDCAVTTLVSLRQSVKAAVVNWPDGHHTGCLARLAEFAKAKCDCGWASIMNELRVAVGLPVAGRST